MKRTILAVLFLCAATIAFGQTGADSSVAPAKADSHAVALGVKWFTVRSVPEGAEVYRGDIFIGKTPVERVPAGEGSLVLRLFYPFARSWNPVMKTDTLALPDHQESVVTVDLSESSRYGILKSTTETAEKSPDLFLTASVKENTKVWMKYAAGAVMIASGVLSAYLKARADKDFDSYVATNNPGLLDSTHRLDTMAGTSLFVAEISFGVLTYLLLSE